MKPFEEDNSKVSIITVCLNSKNYLEDVIKSVHAQSYPNIEHIVIDGGSVDGSLEIFNKYKSRIDKLIIEKDNGIYEAMNKGIRLATGKIIYFLNADDELCDENVVEEAVAAFKENKDVDFVYGDLIVFDPQSKIYYTERYPRKISKWVFIRKTVSQQSTFFDSHCFKKNGYFDEQYKVAADYDWYLKAIFVKHLRSVHIKTKVSVFRLGGISTDVKMSHLLFSEMKAIRKKYFNHIDRYILYGIFVFRKVCGKKIINFVHDKLLLLKGVRLSKYPESQRPVLRERISRIVIFLRKPNLKNGFHALHYHSVTDGRRESDRLHLTVDKELFDKHMRYLRDNRYIVMSWGDMDKYILSGGLIPPKSVFITFDDGYRDNYINVFPVLKKYDIPATIFITINFLKDYSGNSNALSRSELLDMKKTGIVSFGCHGMTHTILHRLDSGQLNKEISQAKHALQDVINGEVKLFAYPFGHPLSYDKKVINTVRSAGFIGAFSAVFGFNSYERDPFRMRRNRISWIDDLDAFEKHLLGYYDWYSFYQYARVI